MILIGDMLGVAPEDRDDLLALVRRHGERAERQRDRRADRRGRWTRWPGYTGFCAHAVARAAGATRPTTS